LNGSDDRDIYIAEDGSDHIYFNNGDRTFTDSGQSLNADNGYGVALADLDSDGDLDAYVANGGGTGAFNTVWINQGELQDGTPGDFLDSGQQLGFNWTEDLALGELDGLPGLDVFTANWFPNANRVWGNDGSANFTDSGQSLGAEGSLGVALADVDDDGDLDAVVGNNSPDGVKIWLNDGTGTFSDSGEAIAVESTVFDVAAADYNHDGEPDLFLGMFGPNQVWFHTDPEPTVPAPGYQPQIVDSRANSGQSTSIALDSNGFPHLAYTRYHLHRDGFDWGIWYARWDGIHWHLERLTLIAETGADDPYAVAIALDDTDTPQISFATKRSIRHARRVGETWDIETLASDELFPNIIAMKLDSSGNPHLVYTNPDHVDLIYHSFDGKNWNQEVIDPTVPDQNLADLVLDDADNPHVSYYRSSDSSLRYAHKIGGNWQSDIVQDSLESQDFPYSAIKIDGAGNPGIAYQWNDGRDVKLARWNGATWSIETIRTVPDAFRLQRRLGLSFDSMDRPHIVFAPSNTQYFELTHMFWNGAQWGIRVIEQSPAAGPALSMTLDGNDDLHLSYYDGRHQSLRYARWGDEFAFFEVDALASVQTTSLGVRQRAPAIVFYDTNSGQVEVADWQNPWEFDGIAFSSNPVESVSAVARGSRLHVSHYDADNQRLFYTRWDGTVETSVIVDETGDVGASSDITIVGQNEEFRRIAYWDASNNSIRLAILNHNDPPVIHVNDQAPALNAASGHVSISELPDLDIAVSYYDGVNGDLRLGIWDSSANSWADHLVAGGASEAGRYHDLRTDGTQGVPVIAYYDETAEQIRFAYGNAPSFTDGPAVRNVSGLIGLSLSLNLDSRFQARILYSTTDGSQFLASLENGVWRVKVLAQPSASTLQHTSMILQNRMHFSFADSLNGLVYGHRVPNLDFAELPGQLPSFGDGFYNPADGCNAVFDWLFDDNDGPEGSSDPARHHLDAAQGLSAPLSDPEVFNALMNLFNFTADGQFYIDLFQTHGSEIGQIGLDDPVLAWDAYGVLQGFMPGLQALVTGTGDELLIDQDNVDSALDFWQRTAAAGSPDLANAINTELAKYNNLQDFVGLSYDEWANAIGVSTPAQLDVIFKRGFE
jgi:hypothetical protein